MAVRDNRIPIHNPIKHGKVSDMNTLDEVTKQALNIGEEMQKTISNVDDLKSNISDFKNSKEDVNKKASNYREDGWVK
jgi:hypothetical protein